MRLVDVVPSLLTRQRRISLLQTMFINNKKKKYKAVRIFKYIFNLAMDVDGVVLFDDVHGVDSVDGFDSVVGETSLCDVDDDWAAELAGPGCSIEHQSVSLD